MTAAGEGAERAAATPLVVRSRFRPIALVALGGVAVTVLMVAIRRSELDADEAVMSGLTLALGAWLVAQACGLFVRRSVAGHAMRLDAAGLHHPGWGVVPWSALRSASLRRLGSAGKRSIFHLVLDIDPGCPGPSQGSYVRWLFGPIEGLWRRSRPLEVPLVALDVDPYDLLAAIERWRPSAHRGAA